MANIDSIKDALCDVRKAHRIIYAYQKRMMGIVRFIGKKLDFPVCEGYKWFSNGASKRIRETDERASYHNCCNIGGDGCRRNFGGGRVLSGGVRMKGSYRNAD